MSQAKPPESSTTFPTTATAHALQERFWRGLMLVVLIGVGTLFPLLGVSHVFQVSEGREGVVVREMLSSGEYLLPLRNGEIVPSKPLLYHWVGAFYAQLAGSYDEFGLRFPSALAALGCLVLLYWMMSQALGVTAGILSAGILLSSYGFYRLAGDGRVDMVFCLFACGAVCLWMRALLKVPRGELQRIPSNAYLPVAFFCGLAVLAKGPLGIVFPGLILAAISFSEAGWRGWLQLVRWPWVVAAIIPAPWYYVASTKGQDAFLSRQFFFENVERFIGGEGITRKPPWFYLGNIWEQGAPWIVVFAFVLGVCIWRYGWKRGWVQCCGVRADRESAQVRLFSWGMWWLLVGLLFFSLSSGKRRGYLVPLLPGFSLAMTVVALHWWGKIETWACQDEALSTKRISTAARWRSLGRIFFCIIWFGALLSYLAVKLGVARFLPAKAALVVDAAGLGIGLSPYVIVFLFLVLGGAFWFAWSKAFREADCRAFYAAVFLFSMLLLTVYLNVGLALKGITHSYRSFAFRVSELVPETTKIKFVKTRKDESFDGFFFYFGRHVEMLDPKLSLAAAGTYLARRSWLDRQSEEDRNRVSVIFEGGRRTDKPEDKLVLFSFRGLGS